MPRWCSVPSSWAPSASAALSEPAGWAVVAVPARRTATATAPPAAPAALLLAAVVDEALDLADRRRGEPEPCRVGGIAGLEPARGLAAARGPLERLALLVLLGPER